jgi:hypothetical protein
MPGRLLLPLILSTLPLATAPAQEALRPITGAPFATEDAFSIDHGTLQLQGTSRYDRTRDGTDALQLSPGAQWGVAPGLELRLFGAYTVGDAGGTNQGAVTPGAFVQLTEERGWQPAFALIGEVEAPFGTGDRGVVTQLTAAASRTTGSGPGAWGVHVNTAWLARPAPGIKERQHRYRLAGALSHVVVSDTSLVAEYVHERQERGENDLSLLQAGLRQRVGRDATFGIALGAGLNEDSPRFRFLLGLEVNFTTGGR